VRGDVHEPTGRSVQHTLELLHLPSLDLGERALDPTGGIGLLAFDATHEIALASREPLGDLMECPTALRRMRFQLGRGARSRFGRRASELLSKPRESGTLLLVGRLQSIGIRVEARLERLDQAALPLGDLLEPLAEPALSAVEILVPRGEPPLDLALDLRERVREPVAQALLALAERLPAGLRQAPLLLRERGEGVRPRPGEGPLELGRARVSTALDGLVDQARYALDLAVDRAGAGEHTPDDDRRERDEHAGDQSGGGDREPGSRLEREGDPGCGRGGSDDACRSHQHPLADDVEHRAGKRCRCDDDAGREDDLEGSLERHWKPS
jgi:hypothetical protein